MPLRDTLSDLVGRPAVRALSGTIRQLVEEILASRQFATPDDVAALRRDLDAARKTGTDDARVKALETEVASLKKRLGMAQGALQAAAQQIADAKRAADEAAAVSKQAVAQAQSALAAAESAADGANELESRAPQAPGEERCAVPGCGNAVRARGMCSRHYAQWKRGSLDEFVSADGSVRFPDGSTFKVSPSYAGSHAQVTPVGVTIGGKVVETTR